MSTSSESWISTDNATDVIRRDVDSINETGGRGRTVVVTGLASDSHTWNLVYLQLLVEELGYDVVNLGPCVPDDLLVSECRDIQPALIVISSVNGHGFTDGMRVIDQLRAQEQLTATPVVIGGKLGVTGGESAQHIQDLVAAGYDAVFEDGADTTLSFSKFVKSMPQPADQKALS
ncbi:methylaspartate mutase sigma subunit [Herbihabitans rhizosphaerae]|uniref:Methylaspartate mutase sigma subunit n=1 Tax=Herbihabitans rhizosphaerae TaxID=1872711 RepID=A0A4Q7KEM8_9PSEU|nr:cobalamin-dependent protein [Herbihabitans rhizosphaerae]RZS32715.1 methylaspartate mutase sigma subunit [Herbihabitans rhizosphaerae]